MAVTVKSVPVPPEAAGMKAGLFLRRLLPDLPESVLRKIFAARDVKLDGIRISRDTLLQAGQTLTVYLPSSVREAEPLRIVYEDDDILLVNKPAGVSVEDDTPGSLSLSHLCRLHAGAEAFPPAACHRLDYKTSGLCLFAKNEKALSALEEVFRQRTVEKYYTCLVRGIPKPPAAVCSAFLLKDAEHGKVRVLDHEAPDARSVVTGYETLESGAVSRLKVHLITGRTHQIRAHLAALGHPVLGDDLYGDRAFNHLQKVRSLKLCATELTLHTGGTLPDLDGKSFRIDPPF